MKRSLVCIAFLVIVLTPARASAWFGWLDHLSGPGPYWGLLFDVRAVCFGDRVPHVLVQEAREREAGAAAQPGDSTRQAAATDAWRAAAAAWATATGEDLPGGSWEIQRAKTYVEERQRVAALAGAVGVFFSVCSNNVIRRSSIDFAVDFWQAFHREARFAGGEAVLLSTAKVSYSFPLFRNRKYDVLDWSMGGGMYWVTSRGFGSSLRGVFLEPGRFYLHAPARWRVDGQRWKRLLTLPVFSGAAVLYPNGFEANAFLSPSQIASGISQPAIGAELRPTFAVFINIDPANIRGK